MHNETLRIRNPATLEFVGELAIASSADVAAATARARPAQGEWQAKSFKDRAKVLRRFRDLLIDEQDRLADIVTSETGKPRGDVFGNELF
jgi:succinate-semialdehyde dehydrogenase/glutarate-semialdehyde dehydrogenase